MLGEFEKLWRESEPRPYRESMRADFDPKGERLKEFGTTYGRTIKHRGQLVSCAGALSQSHADMWCVSRAKEHYGWKFREKWWQIWRPKNPMIDC